MLLNFLLIALGVLGLYLGGKYLVKGSVGLSLHFGIPPMIVGLTVMAFGTSAPELIVSIRAALTDHADLAFGNIVGSNIANILLILGVPALIAPMRTDKIDSRIPWVEAMGALLIFWLLLQFEPFTRWQGLILLGCFVMVIAFQIKRAVAGAEDAQVDVDESTRDEPMGKVTLWLLIGVIALPLGAEALVQGAVEIAREFGVSEAVIGLTIVAIGTSLPELAASVAAAGRGETAMAVGNALGSCLFNILLILGVTSVLSSSIVDPSLIKIDVPFMVFTMALMGIFVFGKRPITRGAALLMLALYALYLLRAFL